MNAATYAIFVKQFIDRREGLKLDIAAMEQELAVMRGELQDCERILATFESEKNTVEVVADADLQSRTLRALEKRGAMTKTALASVFGIKDLRAFRFLDSMVRNGQLKHNINSGEYRHE